jgi:hypothetical protein
MNRRRKSDREKGISSDADEGVASQGGDNAASTASVEANAEPACPVVGDPASISDPPIIFMEPLLPPAETLTTTALQQTTVPDYSGIAPRDSPLLPYGSGLPEAEVLSEIPPDSDVSCEVDNDNQTQQSIAEESSVEGSCIDDQGTSKQSQQEIQSMAWTSAVSPVSTGDSDSLPSSSTPISSAHSNVTAVSANTPPSPTTTIISSTSVSAPLTGATGASTNTSQIQPQFQVPYYMPLPFSIPYTPGQPPFLVPGPYPPIAYPPRPYTCGTQTPGLFQPYQYAAPPPGQLAPYGLRPYPYPPWGPYASGTVEANWFDVNTQTQMQVQAQAKSQRKRGRSGEDQAAASEDGLRIVMVQPKDSDDSGVTPSTAGSVTSMSTTDPAGTVSEPSTSPPSPRSANSPRPEVPGSASPAGSSEKADAMVSSFL